nr:MAG TPA: tRNA-(MS(2)IO(6)A)-hydroxylase-like, iron, ferritin, LYASE.5A [Caudoviricetes sp.]
MTPSLRPDRLARGHCADIAKPLDFHSDKHINFFHISERRCNRMVKLSTACRRDEAVTIYKALRLDMAKRLEVTESGRDYAAIAKSFIDVQERIDEMGAHESKATERHASALAQAQRRHLKVVNG